MVPSGQRSSPCHILDSDGARIAFDLGPGSIHAMARQGHAWWRLSHVVLSHYHTDHICDLPHLLFALRWGAPEPRSRPLHILGPPGLHDRAEGLRRAHGDLIVRPGFDVVYHEVERRGRVMAPGTSIHLAFFPTTHTENSIAVSADWGAGTVGYTGDAGPDSGLGQFFRGVDLLVSECSYADPPPSDNHLSCAAVAAMASQAGPGLLVLTHMYPPLDATSALTLVGAAGYGGRIVCAGDGERFRLPPGGA